MTEKIFTADEILAMSDSDSDAASSSDDNKSGKESPSFQTPEPPAKQPEPKPTPEDQPEVVDTFGTIQTSKSANAVISNKKTEGGIEPTVFNPDAPANNNHFFPQQSSGSSSVLSDQDINFNETRRKSYRANQSEIYKQMTPPHQPPPNLEKQEVSIMKSKNFEELESPAKIDEKVLLAQLLAEEDDDSESDPDYSAASSQHNKDRKSNNGSIVSEEDILNRSLQSDDNVDDPIDRNNYIRYASDFANKRMDVLEIVHKNERAFKQVAERLMAQSSQLIVMEEQIPQAQRRLMFQKVMHDVSDACYTNTRASMPQCLASYEEYLCVGESSGSVRLFDTQQNEIHHLTDRAVKGLGVTCLDMKRLDKNHNMFVVCGHSKGQLTLYEVRGLPYLGKAAQQMPKVQISEKDFKHRKTVTDAHQNTIVQAKFIGDFTKEIVVISSDITGMICITTFIDSYLMFRTNTVVFAQKRLGPSLAIQPLLHKQISLNDVNLKNETFQQEMVRKMKEAAQKEDEKPTLVAFGTLNEVYVSLVKPAPPIALLSLQRPVYLKQGSVPYLDWGMALTPTYRDRAYQCLAVAWGNTIQLVVYSNEHQVNQGSERPQLMLDGFYIGDCESIDQVFFLSESLIFAVVNRKDIKILYTQNFTPGVFDKNYSCQNLNTRKMPPQLKNEEEQFQINFYNELKKQYVGDISGLAEKDSGYRLIDDELVTFDCPDYFKLIQEQAPRNNLNVSVCKNHGFNVLVLGQNTLVLRNLVHWEEFIDLIKRTNPDFTKVLRNALDIYNGKMIGLAGLPDQKEQRESMMRERMKDLIKQNVNAVIKEFQAGQKVSQKTLSLATEFCIRVGAIEYIFGELFEMFLQNGASQFYFESLDPFILSGRFKAVKLPLKFLDQLIKNYRNRDIQLLEQAILNLDFTKSPLLEDVKLLCEEEQLSSALIHILNTIFMDEKDSYTTCLSILCSLYNIMMRCRHKKTARDVQDLLTYLENFETSIYDLTHQDAQKMTVANKEEHFLRQRMNKIEVEHSSTYIGYKILWLITLYMEGNRYPAGNLSSLRWRYYVMDIVRFCTNERFMQWFLDFDPDSFFAMLKKIFNDPEPFEFIRGQDDFIAKNKANNPHLDHCYAHSDILTIFDRIVTSFIQAQKQSNDGKLTLKAETLRNAFMFFLLQVAKNKKIDIPKPLLIKLIREQIHFHKSLMRIPKKDLCELIPDHSHDKKRDKNENIYNSLIKRNERDIIQIIQHYRSVLAATEISQFVDDVAKSHLYKLKVLLCQLQNDYQSCFSLFFTNKAIKSDVFQWLSGIQEEAEIQLSQMKELLCKNMIDFVQMDAVKTVKLVDFWFGEDYILIAEQLKSSNEATFSFFQAVLTEKSDCVYTDSAVVGSSTQSQYKQVLIRMIELLAANKVKHATRHLVDYVSRDYCPLDESLKICEKRNQTEACAVLYRRKGKLKEAVALYIKTMVQLSVSEVMTLILHEENIKFCDPLCKKTPLKEYDRLVSEILLCCSKYATRLPESEMTKLWMEAIKSLFDIKNDVFKVTRSSTQKKDSDSDSDSSESSREAHEQEMKFEKFCLIRNQHFLWRMSEHVNLVDVINFLQKCGHEMKYDDFRRTFEEKIETEAYFISIMKSAWTLVNKEQKLLRNDIAKDYCRGFKSQYSCAACNQNLVNKFNKQELWLTPCEHIFHARCIAKSHGQCSICFSELDVLNSFQQLRKDRSNSRATSTTASTNSAASNSSGGDPLDAESLMQEKQAKVRESISQANYKEGKRKIEPRAQRLQRLMTEYDADFAKRYMSIS